MKPIIFERPPPDLSYDVHDTFMTQLKELHKCRYPDQKCVTEITNPTSRWVYFPWSHRLVRLLPPEEFHELRTSRNRNKITREEQQRLGRLTIGVVGLSVGQATAVTLALEGIGGTFRLADFDTLALSNLNRLRAGVHEIDVNKAVLTARAMWEINPYLEIELFQEGVTDENIDAFMSNLDLLFEECDDLSMKVRLREEAKKRRIPVLMETSDRGMLDVERFDLEPDRPLFHGLAGELKAADLYGLSTREKVPTVVAIVGDISPRLAASLVDIDVTLETWPQLASAVSLGAAVNVDTARRILLDRLQSSGRFYMDLEAIIADDPNSPPTKVPPVPIAIKELVRLASLAPSGGNCQPWRFVYKSDSGVLEIHHDVKRSKSFLDYHHRGAMIAIGAAVENMHLAGAHCTANSGTVYGGDWVATATLRPTRPDPWPKAPTEPENPDLANCIELRCTNRKLGAGSPKDEGKALSFLSHLATQRGADLHFTQDPTKIVALGELVARAEKLRFLEPRLHAELMSEIRWSKEEADCTKDGIDISALELDATDEAGLRLLRRVEVVRSIREVGGGDGLKRSTRLAFASSFAIGFLFMPKSDDFVAGGRALQRVWLGATLNQLALQPMTAFLFLLARVQHDPQDFTRAEQTELYDIQHELDVIFPRQHYNVPIMLFRLSIADPPTARSQRRSPEIARDYGH